MEGRPYSEVAALLGVSLDKVKQDVARARKELRRQLVKKGIVLPTALASVLLGGTAHGHVPVALVLVGATILLGAAIFFAGRMLGKHEVQPSGPMVTAPVMEAAPPAAHEVVLGKVTSLLDRATGMKTLSKSMTPEGSRIVRWRFTWKRDPDRDPKLQPPLASMWVTENSYADLVFDRWSGKLDMDLAADGKNPRNIDPLRPIIIGPPGFEAVSGKELSALITFKPQKKRANTGSWQLPLFQMHREPTS